MRNTRHPDVKSEPPEMSVIRLENHMKLESFVEPAQDIVDCAMDEPTNECALIENGCDLEYDEEEPTLSTESPESADDINSQMP